MARKITIEIEARDRAFRQSLQRAFGDLRRFNADVQKLDRQFANLGRQGQQPRRVDFGERALAERARRVETAFKQQRAAVDRSRRALDQYRRSASSTARSSSALATAAARITGSFGALSALGPAALIAGTGVALGAAAVKATTLAVELEAVEGRIRGITESDFATTDALEFTAESARALSADVTQLRDSFAGFLLLQRENIVTTQQAKSITEGLINVQARAAASNEQIGLALRGVEQILTQANVQYDEYRQVIENLPSLAGPLVRSFAEITGGAARTRGELKELIATGELPSEQFLQALLQAVGEFEGAAMQAGETSRREFQLLQTELTLLGETLGDKFAETLGNTSALLAGFVARVNDSLNDVGSGDNRSLSGLSDELDSIRQRLADIGRTDLGPTLDTLFQQAATGAISLKDAFAIAQSAAEEAQSLAARTSTAQRQLSEALGAELKANRQAITEARRGEAQKELKIEQDKLKKIEAAEEESANRIKDLRLELAAARAESQFGSADRQRQGLSEGGQDASRILENLQLETQQREALRRVREADSREAAQAALEEAERLQERREQLADSLNSEAQAGLSAVNNARDRQAIIQAQIDLEQKLQTARADDREVSVVNVAAIKADIDAAKALLVDLTGSDKTIILRAKSEEALEQLKSVKQTVEDIPDAVAVTLALNEQIEGEGGIAERLSKTLENINKIKESGATDVVIRSAIDEGLNELSAIQTDIEQLRTASESPVQFDLIVAPVQEKLKTAQTALNELKVRAEKGFTIEAQTDTATNRIQSLQNQLNELARGVTIPIRTTGGLPSGVGRNAGGWIPGGGPDRDSVFVHATPHEYMVRRTAALSTPPGFLDEVNRIRSFNDFGAIINRYAEFLDSGRKFSVSNRVAAMASTVSSANAGVQQLNAGGFVQTKTDDAVTFKFDFGGRQIGPMVTERTVAARLKDELTRFARAR